MNLKLPSKLPSQRSEIHWTFILEIVLLVISISHMIRLHIAVSNIEGQLELDIKGYLVPTVILYNNPQP